MRAHPLSLALFAAIALSASAGIVEDSGIKGGLVVQIGCGDVQDMAALRVNDSYLVQVLDTDNAKVETARKQLRAAGQYGKVSVANFDGTTLPYADNMVNLIVARAACRVSPEEIFRVLTPGGVAFLSEDSNKELVSRIPHPASRNLSSVASGEGRIGTGFVKVTKPVPSEIDDWSHFLQGPDNNAVALDSLVGTPRGLKWICRPLWTRSHEFLSSLCAMVSADGRVYYIFDEGFISITDGSLPERWTLIARDAFNGLLLWKMPLREWGAKTWRAKALRSTPKLAPKRIVAGDGKLFIPIGYSSSVSAIDAATGKNLATYENTANVQEMRYLDGILLVMMKGKLTAVNTGTGKTAWEEQGVQNGIVAASNGKAFYQKGTILMCSGLKDGKELWKLDMQGPLKQLLVQGKHLVAGAGKTMAIDAESGEIIWKSSINTSRGLLFVSNNQLFTGTTGYDIQTGKVKTRVDASDVHTPGHHARCYPGKACQKFLITPNRGAEFVSLTGGPNTQNDWLRGPCTFGILPCNGLLYSPPNPCFCYPGVKLPGFNAFAAKGMNEA
ncbi:MAG: PQQ-binding-like beta-propeller repeat protein, partial [Kiritimatiellia bacterium]|nr:PQQ-binding-like beta-propeller repeat protein [Kiritimatiellia bacterium]